MIIIEGPRNVGKTYLLNKLEFPYYKLSYHKLMTMYSFSTDETVGFQYGKDYTLLQLNVSGFLPDNLIVDRSFISSIVYSRIFKRKNPGTLNKYFYDVLMRYWHNIKLVFVYGENPVQDRVKDTMDDLLYKDQLETYEKYITRLSQRDVTWFENKFDEKSVSEFMKIIHRLKYEY